MPKIAAISAAFALWLLLLIPVLFAANEQSAKTKDADLDKITWGMTEAELLKVIDGEVVGKAVVINTTFKGHPVTFECRFKDDRLFALNVYPRAKKTPGQYYEDFLTLISQLSVSYGKPKFDNPDNITQAEWVTEISHSQVVLLYEKMWILKIREQQQSK